jgi:hypothetical protein
MSLITRLIRNEDGGLHIIEIALLGLFIALAALGALSVARPHIAALLG